MKKTDLEYFETKLLTAKQTILNSGVLTNTEDLKIVPEDLSDEADLANNTINQQISFSIRSREINKLRKIENALSKIKNGSYGVCEESGEPIEKKRLEKQPWAEYCIEIAEEIEREQDQRYRRA